jgi:hypothetical protein
MTKNKCGPCRFGNAVHLLPRLAGSSRPGPNEHLGERFRQIAFIDLASILGPCLSATRANVDMVDRGPFERVCKEAVNRHALEPGKPDCVGSELVAAANFASVVCHIRALFRIYEMLPFHAW